MADCISFIVAQAQPSPWLETLGRFQGVFIHFSIALLSVAAVVEVWRLLRRKDTPSPAATACLGFGAIWAALAAAAAVSAWTKWDAASLRAAVLDQPTGAVLAAVAIVALLALSVRNWRGVGLGAYRTAAVLCAVIVGLANYLGGALTFAPDAPPIVASSASGETGDSDTTVETKRVALSDAKDARPAIDLSRLPLPAAFPADGKIDFTRDVQPILAHTCYECHGPSKRRGALRLDNKEMTFEGGNTGPAVAPGKSAESVMIKRVLGEGNEKRMPSGRPPLPEYQIKILRAWIDQGATWPDHASNVHGEEERHWAYVPPVHHALAKVSTANEKWPRNGIDHFILARLEKEGLQPSPEADRTTLIRRLSLDLIGLPPTPEEVDAFVADDSLDAYDRLVNRLLASPHYGERWGRHWLDLARYADTNGYEKDNPRSIWPYRDWVIDAINRDVTFDQFTIQQIAGDMLPNASAEDKIATGFHRNTMFNEEGGIDVEEFRYKALVDRVQTTSTTFLGLTMQCANCHNHKYDAISQKEYFEFFALLNNADEPKFDVPRADITSQRRAIERKIDLAEAALESAFPTRDEQIEWTVLSPTKMTAKEKDVVLTKQPDDSILAAGAQPEKDKYTIEASVDLKDVTTIRLEALTDPSLPKNGPGRGSIGNGNFVLSEFKVAIAGADAGKPKVLKLVAAKADFEQVDYSAASAIDNNLTTGWAIAPSDGSNLNQNRSIVFRFAKPPLDSARDRPLDSARDRQAAEAGTSTLVFTLDQQHANHELGKFRLSVGRPKPDPNAAMAEADRRAKFLAQKLAEWEKGVAAKAVQWTQLDPVAFSRRHGATITKGNDNSLLFTGDNLYRDEYQLGFDTDLKGITAIRLEALPSDEQPKGGPGRNNNGGWLLSGLTVSAKAKDAPTTQPAAPLELSKATADISPDTIARAIDGKKDTHWTVPIGDARPHEAVFQLKSPINIDGGTRLEVAILQNYHQQENIGRLRISVTSDPRESIEAAGVPEDVEAIVLTPADRRTPSQLARLKQHFLSVTPMLADKHQAIAALRKSMPDYPTTLVMRERSVPRVTRIMHRGEFLQPKEEVGAGVPAVLPPLAKGAKNRLALARWLVSPQNPLIGRVTMNRVWAQYFGRGIVNTVEDFGIMGEKPSHPELLDWLATEFVRQNWSMKSMHRLIVTSATYRQSSRVTPELLTKDPANVLMARGPRVRVEAETVRDIALAASGLLNEKIGGPSVYPPQPPGVTELSYGPLAWPTSEGPDRYRRGLYTYLKRTQMYPGLMVFDAPTSEVVCARRIRSNTPLQALTTLNDAVYVEAAQALGRRIVEEVQTEDVEARVRQIFRLCVARAPEPKEIEQIAAFYETQLKRFRDKTADPAPVALPDPKVVPAGMDLPEVAAWTMVARTMLNLDETVTKE
ncbi:MAG: PSD1 and planctomycete cytochrome C domain-containing protein [Tepidisphaeraceae bacterium]